MMKYFKLISICIMALFLAILIPSCDDYVSDIEKPIDNVADDDMNDPSTVAFLVKGIQARFATTWDEHSLFAGGLGDEMWFSRDVPQATYTTYEQIDIAEISGLNPLLPQNNSTEDIMNQLAQLRLYADTLIERIENRMAFSEDDAALKAWGLYNAYFYGAVARYMWASYWCLDPHDGGGGVINVGPYIPGNQLYADALERLNKALDYASESDARIVNTLIARINLIQENWSAAKAAADLGLASGDASFDVLFNTIGENQWYYWAGPGRTQFVIDNRFNDYVVENPQEAARVPYYAITGTSGETYYVQSKYGELGSPMVFLSWQENQLMKAELLIREGSDAGGLALVNEVRAYYGIDPIDDTYIADNYDGKYIEMIYAERDKQLCFTGMRLIDQNRFGKDKWHLDWETTWQRLPINQDERDINPNF